MSAASSGETHVAKQHEHAGKAKGTAEHTHTPHKSYSWLIVVLACATGLTVPITVSIVLILRARGVCCGPATAVHQRIDRPAAKPTETAAGAETQLPTVPEVAELPVGEAFDGFEATAPGAGAPASA